ncbi:hypothetical protein CCR75_001000 [Bremia lactucae]|uniref:Phosducin domain-containing protein n=1 Tax=Bremia lactucae TaxID=4779 RepID=A0A976IIT4_BRELC|nr:hypothetical protein CCR75_001000 [Bremia lactucae]
MESFFLQHSVLRDRDSDELGGSANSDSEASIALLLMPSSRLIACSSDGTDVTDQVVSVADPTGPWTQKAVDSETWGKPIRRVSKARDFVSANTGPKGVMNDFKAHKRYQKQEVSSKARENQERQGLIVRLREEAHRVAVLNRITKGATIASSPTTRDPTAFFKSDGSSTFECDDNDFLDEALYAQYTERRVKQMQEAARIRKVYGELEYVSPTRFLELTLRQDNSVCESNLFVHLYHPENYACGLLNMQLELLARKFVHVKFLAMIAKEADSSIEMADLPVLLVYRGQHQEVIVDVARRLDGQFTLQRLEALANEFLC